MKVTRCLFSVALGACPDDHNGILATITEIGVTFCYQVKTLGKVTQFFLIVI